MSLKQRPSIWGRLFMGLVFLFLYAPIFVLIVFSFNNSKSRTVWNGFTLNWYVELFRDSQIMNSLYTTLLVALLSAVIATIAGTFASIGIEHHNEGVRRVIDPHGVEGGRLRNRVARTRLDDGGPTPGFRPSAECVTGLRRNVVGRDGERVSVRCPLALDRIGCGFTAVRVEQQDVVGLLPDRVECGGSLRQDDGVPGFVPHGPCSRVLTPSCEIIPNLHGNFHADAGCI